MKKIVVLLISVFLFSTCGCATIAKGMLRSALGIKKSDKDEFTRQRKKERKLKEQRRWIQHWRDHPNENPAMTDAFKDDYR